MKAAIYARTASGKSTIEQIELCREYIQEQGGQIIGIYDDEGVSAHDLERDGLKTMLEEIDTHKFDTLVFTGYDRLLRDVSLLRDFLMYLDELEIKHVIVKRME